MQKSLERMADMLLKMNDRTRSSMQRLTQSIEKQAAAYGKTGVDRLIESSCAEPRNVPIWIYHEIAVCRGMPAVGNGAGADRSTSGASVPRAASSGQSQRPRDEHSRGDGASLQVTCDPSHGSTGGAQSPRSRGRQPD